MPAKAIAMISGGLDSTLALALVARQGVLVKAINFYTGFCITETQRRKGGRPDGTVPRNEALRAAADLEVEVEYVDISESGYLDMLVHPRYGYGANANPCVDCRIFMMRRAKAILEAEGADFVFTGEVLGQRPKSQRRDTLWVIEKQSGLSSRPSSPLSRSMMRSVSRRWLFGRCPSTSPVKTNWAPSRSMISRARRIMKTRQSTHGLAFWP